MNGKRRRTSLGLALALAATAGLATAASAAQGAGPGEGRGSGEGRTAARQVARVTGSARFTLPYYPDSDVRAFGFDARAVPYSKPQPGIPTGLPTDAVGTVRISHYFAAEKKTVTAEGTVDCLVTGPHTATLTAVIDRVDEGGPEWVGKRLGFSVYDGGQERGRSSDRVGFSWNGVNLLPKEGQRPAEAEIGTCMAPAPYAPVTKGGYTVRHAELPVIPGM
ncbi:hypothetical protein [Streptomyces sp. NPDC097619]|uniref:hypothetical protein n=1 Tax=Streptomyces sp. NPDC097619 TaxID=3157228 RepID=UPI003330C643